MTRTAKFIAAGMVIFFAGLVIRGYLIGDPREGFADAGLFASGAIFVLVAFWIVDIVARRLN